VALSATAYLLIGATLIGAAGKQVDGVVVGVDSAAPNFFVSEGSNRQLIVFRTASRSRELIKVVLEKFGRRQSFPAELLAGKSKWRIRVRAEKNDRCPVAPIPVESSDGRPLPPFNQFTWIGDQVPLTTRELERLPCFSAGVNDVSFIQ
jgi:hypothetical protein